MDEQTEMELGQEAQYVEQESQREQMLSELQEGNRNLRAENELIKGLIKIALDELGVPNKDYPTPVANAVSFLKEALKEPKFCICCEEITEENAHLHRNCGK